MDRLKLETAYLPRVEEGQPGNSRLKVSVLSMGTMTFGAKRNSAKVGNLLLKDVRKLIGIVADAGVNLIERPMSILMARQRSLLARRWVRSASPAC
jgi:hypothetical protein